MTDRTHAGPPAPDERTRDISLPPLPYRLAGRRTDEIAKPPGAAVRERTLAFSSPEMRHRSIEPVRVQPNPRRWPWVVLTLLPILVIVGFGVAWLLLVVGR
jgi:hypothetical protein